MDSLTFALRETIPGSFAAWESVAYDAEIHYRIAVAFTFFSVLYGATLAVLQFTPKSAVKTRPMVVTSTVHGVSISVLALSVLFKFLPLSVFSTYAITLSMGYFLFEFFKN